MYRYSCIYTQTANHSSYQERPKTERNPVDSVSIQNLPKRMLHKTFFSTVKHLCFIFISYYVIDFMKHFLFESTQTNEHSQICACQQCIPISWL